MSDEHGSDELHHPKVGDTVLSSYETESGTEEIEYEIEDLTNDGEPVSFLAVSGTELFEVYVDDAEGKLHTICWDRLQNRWVEYHEKKVD